MFIFNSWSWTRCWILLIWFCSCWFNINLNLLLLTNVLLPWLTLLTWIVKSDGSAICRRSLKNVCLLLLLLLLLRFWIWNVFFCMLFCKFFLISLSRFCAWFLGPRFLLFLFFGIKLEVFVPKCCTRFLCCVFNLMPNRACTGSLFIFLDIGLTPCCWR